MSTPLPVYYPDGGRLLLMRWWTDDDRGHVILARSESAMRIAAQRVFHRHPDASLSEYLEVEIVAPSLRLCALAAEHTRRERVETFRVEMTWRMREAREAGRALPAPFSVCGSYEPEEEEKPSSEDAGEWARHTHYGCRHCTEGIVLAISAEELHGRFAAAWQAREERRQPERAYKPDRRLVASRARVADDEEPLWYACAVFGPHASGIVLREVDLADAKEYRPEYLSDRVLFFYRRLAEPDSSHLGAILEAESAENKAAFKRHEDDRKVEFEREKRERMDAILSLFAGEQASVCASE